jgi:DNA replication licensing factor MCM3
MSQLLRSRCEFGADQQKNAFYLLTLDDANRSSPQRGEVPYDDRIRSMMEKGDTRLLIDIGEIRDYDSALAQNILNKPSNWLPSFDKTLTEKVADLSPDYGKENKVFLICYFRMLLVAEHHIQARFSIGFEGNFGTHHVTPKTLNASLVNKLVCIDGIVTKCSLVR